MTDLDHFAAAEHLSFTSFCDAEVEVRGWPALDTEQEQADWIRDLSDHGLLFCEVQGLICGLLYDEGPFLLDPDIAVM